MHGAQSTFNTLKKITVVLGSTILPIIFIQIIWPYIERYWRLLLSVLSFGFGGLFLLFYFKAYTPRTIMLKIKAYLNEKQSVDEYLFEEFGKTEVIEKSKDFLFIGMFFIAIAIYFLVEFIVNYTSLPEEEIISIVTSKIG